MTDRRPVRSFDRRLAVIAGALAYVVAAVHLFHPSHGFARLVLVLTVDPGLLALDPRPLWFVLSAVTIVVAVPAVLRGVVNARPVLVLGVVLMATYLVGYFGWHLSGHGGFIPGREPLYHGMTPVEAVGSHLTTDPWAAVAVPAELGLLVALGWLLSRRR